MKAHPGHIATLPHGIIGIRTPNAVTASQCIRPACVIIAWESPCAGPDLPKSMTEVNLWRDNKKGPAEAEPLEF